MNTKNREEYEQSRKKALQAGAKVNPTHKVLAQSAGAGDWGEFSIDSNGIAIGDSYAVRYNKKDGMLPKDYNKDKIGTKVR